MYGYTSEFDMNAHAAQRVLKQVLDGQYFVLKEGMGELIKRMVDRVKNKRLNSRVLSVERHGASFRVQTTGETFHCRRVVFAVPAAHLSAFDLVPQISHSCVRANNLLRIYAIYDKPWAEGLKSFTTTSFLRHVIPISPTVVMAMYTEGVDSMVFFKGANLIDENTMSKRIHDELRRLLPDRGVPDPVKLDVHYWPVGDHIWLPGYDSDAIHASMLNPSPGIFVCGEAFSLLQSWMEGALQTADDVCKKMKRQKTVRRILMKN